MIEEKVQHFYCEYGRIFEGYGPSMDSHYCGDPSQPCVKINYEREVSDWRVVDHVIVGNFPPTPGKLNPKQHPGESGESGKI